MTRRVRCPLEGLAAGERVLPDATSHYLTRVLRLAAGARLVLFEAARGLEADAEVLRVHDAIATVRISAPRPAELAAALPITWIHALSKGDKLDDVVRDATELGATRILVVESERSVVHLDVARATARRARWEKIAADAARQSGRGDPPPVLGPLPWDDALAAVDADAARFCLHTKDAPPLAPALLAALAERRPLAFAAGPEGGLTDDEVLRAEQRGFARASLGPFVLRTETVAAAVLGACRVLAAAGD
jgi:16S rRNA (uracil1498-N3)-methyltransferase